MANTAPHEIVAGPGTIYHAPVATAFPDVDVAPAAAWVKIGTSGDLNYGRDGITISMPQTINMFRSLGAPGPRKAFRSEEDLMVRCMLADMDPDAFNVALDFNDVDKSTSGEESIGLSRNYDLETRAVLVRFDFSPLIADGASQYQLPIAVMTSSPEMVYRGGDEPVMYAIEFTGLIDVGASSADERFGRYVCES